MIHGPSEGFETKGLYNGLCNRGACLLPNSKWRNRLNGWHYCRGCASMINQRNMDWDGKPLCEYVEPLQMFPFVDELEAGLSDEAIEKMRKEMRSILDETKKD